MSLPTEALTPPLDFFESVVERNHLTQEQVEFVQERCEVIARACRNQLASGKK